MNIPSAMVCEAHAKGFCPVFSLWREVRKTVNCTKAQFSDAMSDHPSEIPSIQRIRKEVRKILDGYPEITRDSLRIECAKLNMTIKDIYNIYIAEHPDRVIGYERFRQAAAEPYTASEYHIAKAADEIIDRIRRELNEQAE